MTTSVINSDDGLVSGTSGLKTTGGDDGNLNIQSNGTTVAAVTDGAFSISGNNISAQNSLGFRNRIINGDMRIDQRNAGAAVTPTVDPTFVIDRFYNGFSQASKMTVQQQTSVVPAGFSHAMKITVASAVTPGAGDYFILGQPIEANNVSDFGFGTANAQTVTLSFKVNSSVSGTYSGALKNTDQSRSYPFTFSIPSANTWTTISVSIPGDTTGTWLTSGNGIGISLQVCLGGGATYLGTAGAWAATNYVGATGTTQWISTAGATFYITGVQLEAGSVATPFERRDYGRELIMCQRYFYDVNSVDNVYSPFGVGVYRASNSGDLVHQHPVQMRASPTVTTSALSASNSSTLWLVAGDAITYVSAVTFATNRQSTTASFTSTSSGLTNRACYGVSGNTNNMKISFSAEL